MDTQALIFQFDDVRVDVQNAQVFKAGRRLSLEPKAFRVLVFLLEHPGRLIEKEELLSAIWTDAFVTENALARAIALLRKTLGDTKGEPKYIETVPTRGYRFIAAMTAEEAGMSAVSPASSAATGAQTAAGSVKRRIVWASLIAIVLIAATVAFSLVFLGLGNSHPTADFRPIQVTNSTALDMSPSFSPDGNTIAYCSNENGSFEIYLRQLTPGGSGVQLTNDGGRNMQPTWSPDGTTIAYYSHAKGGIWLIPALGGMARQLTTFGSSPAWSPDSQQIVFESDGIKDLNATASVSLAGATLWIVSPKDGVPHQLTQANKPYGALNNPSWSPDGKSILFTTDGFKLPSALWTVSPDGSHLTKITERGAFDPVFGRDARHIYASAEFGIWELFLDGKRDKFGPERRKIFATLPDVPRHLAISADGRKIAFARVRTISNVYSLPMSGDHPAGAPVPLTNDTRLRKTNPAVSPDGRQVLFDVGSLDRNGGVWVIDSDRKNSRPILVPCENPGWFPGGQSFLCDSYVEETDPACRADGCWGVDILKVRLASGTSERLLHIGQDADFVAYSRDGKQVAFMSEKNGPPNVWVASLDGGAPRQITFDADSMGFPSWSPDGKVLAVEQKHGDNAQIWTVEPGKAPIQLTNVPGQNWPASFSPDGDKIAFAGNRNGFWNLWWVSRRDHSERQLTSYTSFNHFVRYPDWAADGKSMAYEYAETTGNIWMLELK